MKPPVMILAFTIAWLWTTAGFAAVGFSRLQVPDARGAPIEVGIWYPTQGTARPMPVGAFVQHLAPDAPLLGHDLPLVVISHGNGGNLASHSDTAWALAAAGFVVAAPTHPGDNDRDQSRALDMPDRARQLSAVIDALISRWRPRAIDARRIGAFGFSSGGLTVLVAAGAEPDLALVGPHCAAHPTFYDCQLIKAHGGANNDRAPRWPHDAHLRAIAVAAPALGFTLDARRLSRVTLPVQLWRAADDKVLPQPFYAEAVRRALPRAPEYKLASHAGHYDFLAPCSKLLASLAPVVCVSEPGFDRAAFHQRLNCALIGFFTRTLQSGG